MSDWKLKRLEVKLNQYGDNRGKYSAQIEFMNGDVDEFTFALSGVQTQAFLDLIADRVVTISEEMSERLAESLGVDRTKPEDDIEQFFSKVKHG